MRVFVPRVGTILRLSQEWSFEVFADRRNSAAALALGRTEESIRHIRGDTSLGRLILPANTVVVVDRVYVRQAINSTARPSEYDSITFRVRAGGIPELSARKRFFARIEDVNMMDVEILTEDPLKPAAKATGTLSKSNLNRRRYDAMSRLTSRDGYDTLFQAAQLLDAEATAKLKHITGYDGTVKWAYTSRNPINCWLSFHGKYQVVAGDTLSQKCKINMGHHYSVGPNLASDGHMSIQIPATVTFNSETGRVITINIKLDGEPGLNVSL